MYPSGFAFWPSALNSLWFRSAYVVFVLFAMYAAYAYRLRRIAQQFELRLEERVSERTRIARDLHDTLLQTFQALMLRLQVVDGLLPWGRAKEQLEQTLKHGDQAIAEGERSL